ncbi:hypothetical protein SBRY_40246 [Actinacidiphila bryophytorum]|uniref:Uncharacterized protein n=1 Tax=Actinacidiphila bryophytorum TaxID=1436133 RepID=A0A9W4MB52_9ACTN|nr:hypothetical protein SBRY_40246 [Actinacidiphila bryophytorum]
MALERQRRPAAVAVEHRDRGLAGRARVHQDVPDRLRGARQRTARDAVLLLRPADRRHPLPVDAAEQHRHRRAPALQPHRRRGADPRRDDRQGPHRGGSPRPEVLHHVRRHRLDDHAVGHQDRLDQQDEGIHRLTGLCDAERQAGRVHLGLRLRRQPAPVQRRRVSRRRQLVQGPGLLRHRRGADLVAYRRPGLAPGLLRRLPRLPHDLAVDGRPDRQRRRRRQLLQRRHRPGPRRMRGPRHRLPAVRPARRRHRPAARARRLHVAAVLQHVPRRGAGHLHLDVRRVQRGQPDRQDRRVPGLGPHQLRLPGPRRGRHRLLLRLLPAPDRRRRPHAQGPDRPHRDPPDEADHRLHRQPGHGGEPASPRQRAVRHRRRGRRLPADRQPHRDRAVGAVRPAGPGRRQRRPARPRQQPDRLRRQRRGLPADRQPHLRRRLGDLPAGPQLGRHGQPQSPGERDVRDRGERGRRGPGRQPDGRRRLGAVRPDHRLSRTAGHRTRHTRRRAGRPGAASG